MKFKIFDKTVKKTFGPFNMSDIKAYDGENHSIFFTNGNNPDIVIGDDLGYGKNNTEKIQDNLVFLLFSGVKDLNGQDLYDYDIVDFIQDASKAEIQRGIIYFDDGFFGVLDMGNNKSHDLKDLYSVEFKKDMNFQ